jgi:hypothetical protein
MTPMPSPSPVLERSPDQHSLDQTPLALTDDQLSQILSHAAPLTRSARRAFVADVVAELVRCEPIGDGVVFTVCRKVQRRYWDPPLTHSGKYD